MQDNTLGIDEDDIPCIKCGGALDTGLECTECGFDNYEQIRGVPFKDEQLNPWDFARSKLEKLMQEVKDIKV